MSTVKTGTKHLALAGIFLAIGIIMPHLFHFAGQQAGTMFLPLFWGVVLAALMLPMKYTLCISIVLPILSNLLSGMPPIPMLYFMLIELVVYGVVLNLFSKKMSPFLAVAVSLLISRTVYCLAVVCAAELFHLPAPYAGLSVLLGNIALSIPGIALQIVVAPLIYKLYLRVDRHETSGTH